MTKAEEKKEIQSLRRKCLPLWTKQVKENARGQCEARENGVRCKEVKFLHAHHIESYAVNRDLRYDPKNGTCMCAGHHKFKRKSAHKSFVFMYEYMTQYRQNDLHYLIQQSNVTNPETKESLLAIIKKLTSVPQLIIRRIK